MWLKSTSLTLNIGEQAEGMHKTQRGLKYETHIQNTKYK